MNDKFDNYVHHSPVIRTRDDRHANDEMSISRDESTLENARISSSHSPKPRSHCWLWRTFPLQNTTYGSSGLTLWWEINRMRIKLLNNHCNKYRHSEAFRLFLIRVHHKNEQKTEITN